MPMYRVSGYRKEAVTFHVEAETPQEAENLAWEKGEEIITDLLETYVHCVDEV